MDHHMTAGAGPLALWRSETPSVTPSVTSRAIHARMLSFAASRRRAAEASLRQDGRVEALYWKSCAPGFLDRAKAVRCRGLAVLP